jgi:hypothetical protein
VNAADVATPELFVRADVAPPAKLPLGPDGGAENVTVTLLRGLPPTSVTLARKRCAKATLMGVLCGVPPAAVTAEGLPAVFVSENVAGAATPATDADTV